MQKIVKTLVDLVESLTITSILDTKFWQDLIIAIVVIVANAFIIPLIKYLFNSLLDKMRLKGIISDEEFRQHCLKNNIKISEEDVKTIIAQYNKWKEENKK